MLTDGKPSSFKTEDLHHYKLYMNIAFCNNPIGLTGLQVTVSSLIQNCSDASRLTLWFLCAEHSDTDKKQIKDLLQYERFEGKYHILDFSPIATFGEFCSLHGDWTCYGRLLLADYIDADEVLYLDSDLVVETDVLILENFNLQEFCIAAVGGCEFRFTLGHKFYIEQLHISPDLEYFNDGVMLLNLRVWRERKMKEQCLEIARKYPMDLPSHDQSILNIICKGEFARLPAAFNCEWPANKAKPTVADLMVLHFVGSPKPWDPFASLIHKGAETWSNYRRTTTALGRYNLSPESLKRAWHIRRSYLRYLRDKFA